MVDVDRNRDNLFADNASDLHSRSDGALATQRRGAENSLAGYLAPLRQTLIDNNERHVNVIVCESDYRALKRGI